MLSVDEQGLARRIGKLIPNVQLDPPPGQFLNNNVVAYQQPGPIEENTSIPSYLDLSSIQAQLNTSSSEIMFTTNVFGNISSNATGLHYWTLVNSDNNERTGAGPSALNAIGVPETNFTGADFVARLDVDNLAPSGQVWTMQNGKLTELTNGDLYRINIGTTVSTLDYANIPCDPDSPCQPQYNNNTFVEHKTVSISLNNELVNVALDKPFSIQALSVGTDDEGNTIHDDINSLGSKRPFVLSYPVYPHCFPQSDGIPGGTVLTQVTGLLPNSPIHALLGPIVVAHGKTDSNGNATINFPIPSNTSEGTHLITVGVDDTALTADCNVQVVREPGPENHPPVAIDQNITTHENVLKAITLTSTDPDNDTLTYSIVTDPSAGTLSSFNPASGILTYTPNTNYFGPDTFTFKATDSRGAVSNAATVSIVVKGIPNCEGATIVGNDNRNDFLQGTAGSDVIVGLGGNDLISGNGGDDEICGGSGNDVINGDAGVDQLYGLDGVDTIDSRTNNDLIDGGLNFDIGSGGSDQETCFKYASEKVAI
ncbi:MAG TPA: Ig-like domain-containing protein, partial [Nitrososphaera sp.]